ncbi:MAG: NADH:ubiquinone oxidoreductase [Acidimicrobiales bacterium]
MASPTSRLRHAVGSLRGIPGPVQAHTWVARGLREGIVTTRYPRRPDGYGPGWRGAVSVVDTPGGPGQPGEGADVPRLCPTGAITEPDGRLRVDRGRCIVCGRCVAARPDLFLFDSSPEVASLSRQALVVPAAEEGDEALERLRAALLRRVRALRRSVHIRHVDAGSDGSEEWEVAALANPVYDVQRLGVFFTATPRHADLLLVTGVGTAGMAGPLRRTWEAMPDPKVVLAAGTDAVSGGLVHPTYATRGGIGGLVPVDVWVPGSPPSPFSLLHGILLGVGLLPARGRR